MLLVRRLAVYGRVGEPFVIEDPVSVDPFYPALQSVEVAIRVASLFVWDVEALIGAYLEVASRFSVIQVYAKLGAVDAEGELFLVFLLLVLSQHIVQIERIPEEQPSPPEVNAYLHVGVGAEGDTLSAFRRVSSQAHVLVPIASFQHEGQVVLVRRDVNGIDGVELFYFLAYPPARLSPDASDVVGQVKQIVRFVRESVRFQGRGLRRGGRRVFECIPAAISYLLAVQSQEAEKQHGGEEDTSVRQDHLA